VKVCDFGLSRFVENDDEEKHKTLMTLRGTYAYVAPEVYQKKGYTYKADIYSLRCFTLTGRIGFSDLTFPFSLLLLFSLLSSLLRLAFFFF